MIGLSDFINKKPVNCDAHIHLFDGVESDLSLMIPGSELTVAFADIRYREPESYVNGSTLKAYEKFIKKDYPKVKDRLILLSTASSAEEAISIYNKHKDAIKGFGEFKCYGFYRMGKFNGTQETVKLPYGNLDWLEPLFEFDSSKKLPIYIHYSIYDSKRVKKLEDVLERYPDIPFVLCHCGMGNKRDKNSTLDELSRLMKDHQNLWVDISFAAMDIFVTDRNAIHKLPSDRLLIGSDFNPVIKTKDPQELRNLVDSTIMKMEVINGYGVDFYGNLKRLFSLGK